MAKMSDKTKRAINAGRRRAGLKPIKFGAKKKKSNPHSIADDYFKSPRISRYQYLKQQKAKVQKKIQKLENENRELKRKLKS